MSEGGGANQDQLGLAASEEGLSMAAESARLLNAGAHQLERAARPTWQGEVLLGHRYDQLSKLCQVSGTNEAISICRKQDGIRH